MASYSQAISPRSSRINQSKSGRSLVCTEIGMIVLDDMLYRPELRIRAKQARPSRNKHEEKASSYTEPSNRKVFIKTRLKDGVGVLGAIDSKSNRPRSARGIPPILQSEGPTSPQPRSARNKPTLKTARSYNGSEKKNVVGEYHIIRTLGKGSQAVIKLGMHIKSGRKVAIKVMSKLSANKLQFQREALALKILKHKHIVTLEDAYESSKYLFLVLEYCPGGDLFDYVISKDGLERKECLLYYSQIVRAVMHSHKHGIIHRDIKPENILMGGNNRVVLTDFGLCGVCANEGTKTLCGSPHYASPELCKGMKYDFKSDSWSLGVLLYTMICASYPFEHRNINKLINKITQGEYVIPSRVPQDVGELISGLLVVDPSDRMPVGQIWKSRCFYMDGKNRYFYERDFEKMPSSTPVHFFLSLFVYFYIHIENYRCLSRRFQTS
ncbi:hypothetical protein AAMO2058_000086900 [Amorphochlora amoebiformis]